MTCSPSTKRCLHIASFVSQEQKDPETFHLEWIKSQREAENPPVSWTQSNKCLAFCLKKLWNDTLATLCVLCTWEFPECTSIFRKRSLHMASITYEWYINITLNFRAVMLLLRGKTVKRERRGWEIIWRKRLRSQLRWEPQGLKQRTCCVRLCH